MHYSFKGKMSETTKRQTTHRKEREKTTLTLTEGLPEFQVKQLISQSASRDGWALDSQ